MEYTAYATIEDMSVGTMASNSTSLLYSTSTANIAAPNGALNMLPIPPATPHMVSILRSLGLSLSFSPSHEPNPAPIWAMGPSLPALPPLPIVIDDAIVFIKGILARISPPSL